MRKGSELPRVRIKKEDSDYFGKLGVIAGSNCNGTFRVVVLAEGQPTIDLEPEDVEPC